MQDTSSSEEIQNIEKLRNGDKNVLVSLFKSNFVMVRNYIVKNKGVDEDAEDVLQDALVVLWQNVRKPEFQLTVKISTYLMAVVKNLWLKQLQKNSRMLGEENIAPQNYATSMDEGKSMDMKKIAACMDEIGDTCKQLLTLFYFDGFDMEAIAKEMGFNNSDTTKAKKYQCFKKLEEIVKKRYAMSDFLR